jgi:phytoene dehydrogenase-like protein
MAKPLEEHDVVIVGAGLAGLAAAIHLTKAGRSVSVVEASDGVGGRVRTDIVDGFLLDRGFQVLLTAYPEAKRMFDYDALDLRFFQPASLVQMESGRARIGDPFREPLKVLDTVRAPIGTLADKVRVGLLRTDVKRATLDSLWTRPEVSTEQRLRDLKFSPKMIESFFRPFFAGIQLDSSLQTSSRMFDFIFRMLADGGNAIPARGMGVLATQLAGKLPAGTIRLNAPVNEITDGGVFLADGDKVRARNVVIATEGPAANHLLKELPPVGSNRVTCVYFAASSAPVPDPIIVLNGNGSSGSAGAGPVNNVCVPSNVSPLYAPPGSHLISASVIGDHRFETDADLVAAVQTQLGAWFGSEVSSWEHLRTYDISHAQPSQRHLEPAQRPVSLSDSAAGVYVCGDHRDTASIQGALLSGRRVADAILTAKP